ncbi:phosphoglycerate kinase [Syntrophomonas palmitatica]|uniref:phosphoglycerate kinase n=1 Tax=Syntrophomonas palmitatica TaxID=402877 RepID=UPI0034E2E0E8
MRDAKLEGKRVLLRVDFNVPMDKEGDIIDDTKIRAALPTIEYILGRNASIILMSHLGRPQGKPDEKYSLKKLAVHLSRLLNKPVAMAPDCIGEETEKMADSMQPGSLMLLENLRFHNGEEQNDPEFASKLAKLGDIYVNDAFGTAHRAHASTAGLAAYLPAYAGFLMENEVNILNQVLDAPDCPRMAIMGGAKVADKLGLIDNMLDKMDILLIGGGMANTFLKAIGKKIGKSMCEDDLLNEALRLLQKAQEKKRRVLLPVDAVVAEEISNMVQPQVVSVDAVPDDMMILDIGPQTVEIFKNEIMKAHTIVWNGPMGVYEYDAFAEGTRQITLAIAQSKAVSVIGGGDSAVAAHDMGLEKQITHISTGGGATLEFLEGLKLPGVAACGL